MPSLGARDRKRLPPAGAVAGCRPQHEPSPRLPLYGGPLPEHRVVLHPRPQGDQVAVVTAARMARLAGGDNRKTVVEVADVDDLAVGGRPGTELVVVVGGVAGLPYGVGVAAHGHRTAVEQPREG